MPRMLRTRVIYGSKIGTLMGDACCVNMRRREKRKLNWQDVCMEGQY